ncbi:hypothetical protein M569_07073, partial [Genlisea aurea]
MPLKRVIADVLGVATICLVSLLVLLGLYCIIYSLHFRKRVHGQGQFQLNYFAGPWIIRIVYILFAFWWGMGEIIRLNLFRHNGRALDALSLQWQENLCKCYVVSNLGFSEPCLFLTLIFLLRATVQSSGMLTRKWNWRTAGYVLAFCLPMLILQLLVILVGPKYKKELNPELASYFIEAASSPRFQEDEAAALCTYPLFSTIFLGFFATGSTLYLFRLGRRILHLVINKGLQKRVYTLILCISSSLPLRVLLLGLSVLSEPERLTFDAISFLAFLCLVVCAGVAICVVVYLPIVDSLSLRTFYRSGHEYDGDALSMITNRGTLDGGDCSPSRASLNSAAMGSVSFRTTEASE